MLNRYVMHISSEALYIPVTCSDKTKKSPGPIPTSNPMRNITLPPITNPSAAILFTSSIKYVIARNMIPIIHKVCPKKNVTRLPYKLISGKHKHVDKKLLTITR